MWIRAQNGTLVNTDHLRKIENHIINEVYKIDEQCPVDMYVAVGYFAFGDDRCHIKEFETGEECDKYLLELGNIFWDKDYPGWQVRKEFKNRWLGKD